jgi:capsid assembly protease
MKDLNDLLLLRAKAERWAIWQDALDAMLATGNALALPAVPQTEMEIVALAKPGPKVGKVALVPIVGGIAHRGSFWSSFFGGATVERLTKTLRDYAADPSVGTVLLDVDSPGGTVSGLPELAAEIRRTAETKHVVALANDLAASAAYWIASQADEIIATPEALVGSIGVFTYHVDYSQMMAEAGIKITYIHAGKYKVEGNPNEPLSDEARDHIQSQVESDYNLFVADVAKGRKVSTATVRSDFGQGRVLTAADAKAAGMIDRVATADETIRRLTGNRADSMEAMLTHVSNSQAQNALKRRRLELLNKIYEEDVS